MTGDALSALSERLAETLRDCGTATIAVSGGVDSMTLASFARRHLGSRGVGMVHAVSPAVPRAATERVRERAREEGWRLEVVDAGEFADERYRANPLDRCFFCKSNLYATLGAMSGDVILSGTNRDDLGDFRPGLAAAAEHSVRHPFVEAGFAKPDVRALAVRLGLPEIAALPASPCLASRIETGIRIEPRDLSLVERMEAWFHHALEAKTVRCRIRGSGLVIELDPETIGALAPDTRRRLIAQARTAVPETAGKAIAIAPYRRGSAFVGEKGT